MSGFIPQVDGWSHDLAVNRPRVFIRHGAEDPVIGAAFARAARETLLGAGIEPDYRETRAGHWLAPEVVAEARDFVSATLRPGSGAQREGTQPAGNAPAGTSPG